MYNVTHIHTQAVLACTHIHSYLGQRKITLIQSVKQLLHKILAGHGFILHKQNHTCVQKTHKQLRGVPVGPGSMWPSVWARGRPRQTDRQRSGWRPGGSHRGSGSCGIHRPGQHKSTHTDFGSREGSLIPLRQTERVEPRYLFIPLSWKESEAGNPKETSLLILGKERCVC